MLSIEDQKFISEEMKISLKSIDSKFNECSLLPYKKQLEAAISFFIYSIRTQNKLGYKLEASSYLDSPAEKEINKYYAELSEIFGETEATFVLDSLRHAFCSFAYNGLHQLFTCQENEAWYPKIILDEELKPNDINELPSVITLYRGTDIAEFNSRNYGQSWTTCKNLAHDFAFKHYAGQPWFKKSERIVLETKISKEYAYFSHQSCEFEVAIDTSKITCVKKTT
ncbi:hypothetical protein [Pseudomonas mandelii]|jgi:hypothetical protein|uniref:hypothetical protein n=1 Tax=Pseudomonas mandelii TaxID=75612 RepID=UPI0003784D23|nr:hypothetical protein [Pseudomonas mandelii]